MALKPHIVHVVGHTEAHHAATAEDVIAACKVARRAIENALAGAPDMGLDPRVQQRANELAAEAQVTLDAIRGLGAPGVTDPFDGSGHAGARRDLRHPGRPASPQQPLRGARWSRIDRGANVAVDTSGRSLLRQSGLPARLALIQEKACLVSQAAVAHVRFLGQRLWTARASQSNVVKASKVDPVGEFASVEWDAPKARRKPDAVTPLADIISKRKKEVSQCRQPRTTL